MRLFVRLLPVAAVLLALCCAGCAKKAAPPVAPPPAKPRKTAYLPVPEAEARALCAQLDPRGQGVESWTALEPALRESLAHARSKPPMAYALERPELSVAWGELARGAELLLNLLPMLDDGPAILARRFDFWALAPEPLSTGYYLPGVEASLTPRPDYPYPFYKKPGDLLALDLGDFHERWAGQRLYYRINEEGLPEPYFDRGDIDFEKALIGRGLELAWARSLYDVNNVQTQGSGILHLPDGSKQRIGYDGKNGREFRGVWGVLRRDGHAGEEGLTPEIVKSLIDDDPQIAESVLRQNPSYVFFRLLDGPVLGSMGRPLMDRVSFATDPGLVPLGAMFLFSGTLPPYGPDSEEARVTGIGLAQDTGGAIKGRRLDYFWGEGERAQYAAFRTKTTVGLYLLVPKR